MRKILILFLVTMLLITGCGSNNGRNKIVDVNYYEGSDGLVMEFMTNSPPEKMYPEQPYPITMTIHNRGAFSLLESLTDEDIYASATLIYDPFYFTESLQFRNTARELRERLVFEGKSVYLPGGESKVVTLGVMEANFIGPNRIGADTDIGVSLCFPYETRLATQVCVDNDPYENTDPSQVCHVEDLSFVDQGAPVAVKTIKVETIPVGTQTQEVLVRQGITDDDGALIGFEETLSEELVTIIRPVFRISIDNVGDGQVIRGRERGEQKLCLKEMFDDLPSNSLVVTALLGNTELECTPDPIVMFDDRAEVVCMLKPDDDLIVTTNYYGFLQVYVDYVYQIRDKITVQIDDSMQQYTPPSLTDFTCMDFDNDYASCRSYSQSAGPFNDNLDCYYCESLKKCFEASYCDECPDGTIADEYARKCSDPCPKPSISIVADIDTNEATFTCRDHNLVGPNDRNRCGCKVFAYDILPLDIECPPVNSMNYRSRVTGEYNNNMGTAVATIDIPEHAMYGSQMICAIGLTDGTGATAVSLPRKFNLFYPYDVLNTENSPLDNSEG